MTVLAQDTFIGRTITTATNSWGTASDGNTWAKFHGLGAATVLSVSSGEGRAHSGGTDCQMLLGSGTAGNQEGLVRLAMGQAGDSIGVILRCDATGTNYYYAEIGDFTNDLAVYKVVSGAKTNLDIQAAGFTVPSGSFYWMRFQAIGTALKCRLWADGASEPGTWQSSVTDSAIASGQYGLFINSFGTTDAQFDSYQANDAGGGGGGGGIPLVNSAITAMPIISRGVPAYTNDDFSGSFPASKANNDTYYTSDMWRCAAQPTGGANSGTLTQSPGFTTPFPVYLAYDLSGVPSAQRQNVVLVWYNDPQSSQYNAVIEAVNYFNCPTSYTIDTNTAAGGTLPTSGWTTAATETNQPYNSKQHAFNLNGANWVRIRVTAINGSISNNNCAINMDVHDAHPGNSDNWIFFGDSITSQGLNLDDHNITGGILSAQIHAVYTNMPLMQDGGIGGLKASDIVTNNYLSTWLPLFSGKYVGLNYGTNDADAGGSDTANFLSNMTTLVNAVISAGKVPVIHKTICWGSAAGIVANGPTINADLATLFGSFPSIVQGPDLWAYFNANQSLISGDGIHPTLYAGYIAYRQQWASALIANVYTTASQSNPPVAPVGVSSSSFYTGRSPVPLKLPSYFSPSSWYAIGGTTLGDQPTICTAPLPQGNALKVGSTFVLLFQSPSPVTQTLLADGSEVQMTFLLFGGQVVTGSVLVSSTLSGTVLHVVCTLLATLPLSS